MELNSKQLSLLKYLNTYSQTSPLVEEDQLLSVISIFNKIVQCTDKEIDGVKKEFFYRHSLSRDIGIGLVCNDEELKPWFANSKALTGTTNWDRYQEYLIQDAGFSESVAASLERDLDQIMDYLGNPASPAQFNRRGLVIGDVQSGKTSTYIGLMNKCADAGYKVIILLTGMIEKLRVQTQERVDLGFLGMDSGVFGDKKNNLKYEKGPIGVGRYNTQDLHVCFTNRYSDFTTQHANSVGKLNSFTQKNSVVFVIKKNVKIMKLLAEWLETYNADQNGIINLPMLLIDDEADNASINTSSNPSLTTAINGAIRKLLKLFSRNSYVGFTATPYANIFIDSDEKDDIFPRHFIYVLRTPVNYVSPLSIFLGVDDDFAVEKTDITEKGKNSFMLDTIDDFERFLPMQHKKGYTFEDPLPDSLKQAIVSFMIANTIRDIRGDNTSHRTMLVNVSRFIDVQDKLRDVIDVYFKRLVRAIKNYSMLSESEALSHKEMSYIKEVFDARYANLPESDEAFNKTTWADIQKNLYASVVSVSVQSVNGGNASRILDYKAHKDSGLRIIAVGGLSLSRGLTLEGLIISYYHRNSKMYDTLMQMGRWFGYRREYADLCRIYMTKTSQKWYSYIAKATEELKSSVVRMVNENKTPIDFGYKVRNDKVTLLVTAKNKMRTATAYNMLLSLDGNVEETKYLINDPKTNHVNYLLVNEWLSNLLSDGGFSLWEDNEMKNKVDPQIKNVPAELVASLIRQFKTSVKNDTFRTDLLSELIISSQKVKPVWDVMVKQGEGRDAVLGPLNITSVKRKYAVAENGDIQISGSSSHLGSRESYQGGITQKQYNEISKIAENTRKNNPDKGKQLTQEEYFVIDRNPLLVIWPVTLTEEAGKDKPNKSQKELRLDCSVEPAMGLSIGFPRVTDSNNTTIRYVINKIAAMQMLDVSNDDLLYDEETGVEED